MSTPRRIFPYIAALIGLLIVLVSLLMLSGQAIRSWSSGLSVIRSATAAVRDSIPWIGLGLAGLALWAVGWLPANRTARQLTLAGAAERASTPRKAYLYMGQLVTLAIGLIEAGLVTADLLRRLLGEPSDNLAAWPEWALARAAGAVIAFLFWGHLRWVTVHDGDFGREYGRAANWRRAYFYLGALGGFILVIAGAIGYLRSMLGLASSALLAAFGASAATIPASAAWRQPIVSSVTELVIGIPTAILIWSTASRIAAGAPAREYGALSRVTLLHGGLVFGTVASLASGAYLLRQALLQVTGGAAGGDPAWSSLITALVCLPVSAVSWLAFANAAGRTVSLSHAARAPRPAPPARTGAAAVRRLTFYLLAAAGLGAFWVGLAELGRVIFAGGASSPLSERFSLGAALVVVGAPAWWGYWWPRQVRARQAGPEGADERRSATRRIYLYGIIAAGVVVLAFSLVAFAMQVAGGSADVAALAGGATALFWLITHGLILRGDRRWEAAARSEPSAPAVLAAAAAPEPAPTSVPGPRTFRREELAPLAASTVTSPPANTSRPVIVMDGESGALGAGLLAALRRALPAVPLWPVGLNPGAQAAMLSALGDAAPPAIPPDAVTQAAVILGPSDLLLPGSLVGGEAGAQLLADLAASSARLILLPPRNPRLRWVAAPEWPDERWIENAVIEVSNVV